MSTEMNIVQVPVKDLVIDLPLDSANVQEKVTSLQGPDGMIQPVVVWANGMRIIDGFHRVAAAGLLNWETVPCIVRECGEEAFWDARIQSAKQHHAISKDRLLAWIKECWRATEWAAPDTEGSAKIILKEAWKQRLVQGANSTATRGTPIQRWLQDHAQKWGISYSEIEDIVEKETWDTAWTIGGEMAKRVGVEQTHLGLSK